LVIKNTNYFSFFKFLLKKIQAAKTSEKREIKSEFNSSGNINNDNKNNFSEPIIIRSDKIKFVGKQTKLPVSSFSRALNFGMLGASILTNTIGNVIVDKVFMHLLFSEFN